jgi:hypothetical protein
LEALRPSRHRSIAGIAGIAARWGVPSPAHFTRTFQAPVRRDPVDRPRDRHHAAPHSVRNYRILFKQSAHHAFPKIDEAALRTRVTITD